MLPLLGYCIVGGSSSQPAGRPFNASPIYSVALHRSAISVDEFIANASVFISTTPETAPITAINRLRTKPKGGFSPHRQGLNSARHTVTPSWVTTSRLIFHLTRSVSSSTRR